MSDPRREFVEAMRYAVGYVSELDGGGPNSILKRLRRACIAFADATFSPMYRAECRGLTEDERGGFHSIVEQVPIGITLEQHRAALVREVGLEESDGG